MPIVCLSRDPMISGDEIGDDVSLRYLYVSSLVTGKGPHETNNLSPARRKPKTTRVHERDARGGAGDKRQLANH